MLLAALITGLFPSAAPPTLLATTPHASVAPAVMASTALQSLPTESNPVPQPNVPPQGKAAHATIGAAAAAFTGEAAVLVPTWGANPGGVWHYTPSNGWILHQAQGLPTAKYWLWIAVDPFNSARWLLLGNSTSNAGLISDGNGHVVMADGQTAPLWMTTNAGASWAGITVPSVTVSGYGPYVAMNMTRVEWSDTTPGSWMLGWGGSLGHDTLEDIEVVTRGSLTGATTSVSVGGIDRHNNTVAVVPGMDGDLVVRRQHDFGDDTIYLSYIRAGEDAYAHTSAGNNLVFLDYPDRIPGSMAIVSMSTWGSSLWATPNYRTTDPAALSVTVSGYAVAATKNATYIGGGTGVQQVTDLFGTPHVSTVAGTTIGTGFARADRKTHTAVAALANDGSNPGVYLLPRSGDAWQLIHFPAAMQAMARADRVEVIAGRAPLSADSQRVGSDCQCAVAKPVNTRTGNFWTTVTDLSVTTPGPDLTWTRVYASQAISDTDSALSPGWQHPFAARLITESMPGGEAGTVITFGADTNRERFGLEDDGRYTPGAGVRSTLVQASGVFTQTLQDQRQRIFDAATGRLLRTRDALGRQIDLTYDSATGRLLQVADAQDSTRFLTLTYTTAGQIATVSDGGRTVAYQYTAGDLTRVTDVMSRDTDYTYQNHLLTRITDALGHVVEQMAYDQETADGKLIDQILSDGQHRQFQYLDTTTVLTTTGVDGQQTVARYDYALDNTLAGVTINDQTVAAAGFDATYRPGVAADGNGNLTWTTSLTNGLPSAQTNALGQTTQVQYDAANRPTLVTDTLGIATAYQYDGLGNLTRSTHHGHFFLRQSIPILIA